VKNEPASQILDRTMAIAEMRAKVAIAAQAIQAGVLTVKLNKRTEAKMASVHAEHGTEGQRPASLYAVVAKTTDLRLVLERSPNRSQAYIGQTVRPVETRWREHLQEVEAYKDGTSANKAAWPILDIDDYEVIDLTPPGATRHLVHCLEAHFRPGPDTGWNRSIGGRWNPSRGGSSWLEDIPRAGYNKRTKVWMIKLTSSTLSTSGNSRHPRPVNITAPKGMPEAESIAGLTKIWKSLVERFDATGAPDYNTLSNAAGEAKRGIGWATASRGACAPKITKNVYWFMNESFVLLDAMPRSANAAAVEFGLIIGNITKARRSLTGELGKTTRLLKSTTGPAVVVAAALDIDTGVLAYRPEVASKINEIREGVAAWVSRFEGLSIVEVYNAGISRPNGAQPPVWGRTWAGEAVAGRSLGEARGRIAREAA
jgi:hypothetical protein